jgi:uncharacterized protein YlxP (DUF503 family)
MFVLVLDVELHLPAAGSLKAKRSVVKHLVESARSRYRVAAAEVGHQELWQRARLGFAVVSSRADHAEDVIDEVERYVWSHPEIEVLSMDRRWLDGEA